MRPQQFRAMDVPFSLVCRECDAGMDIKDHAQAAANGWTEIDYAPDLPMANYVGLCPDCREQFEHWLTTESLER
jgi:hypothetical protein